MKGSLAVLFLKQFFDSRKRDLGSFKKLWNNFFGIFEFIQI